MVERYAKFWIIGLLSIGVSDYVEASKFKMGDGVIRTKISYQNLNRIKVNNDRIDSVAGIDTAFHLEKNDKTGEIFIRPTEDNGYSPISISVTTVSGKTQDMLLDVVDGLPNTIELESKSTPVIDVAHLEFPDENIASDYEEQICNVMKSLINNADAYEQITVKASNRNQSHIKVYLSKAYSISGFIALKYIISSKLKTSSRIDERMFAREGDIAISLSSFEVSRNHSAVLYVLRR